MKDNVVQVNLWDKNVGLLSWDDKRGCSVFQFDQDFMQYGWNIAPLVAPLDSVYVQRTFPMSGNREKLYAGLPEFVADSLPDHWGNVVFQKWMEANHLQSKMVNSVDKFSEFIGNQTAKTNLALERNSKMMECLTSEIKVFKKTLSCSLII